MAEMLATSPPNGDRYRDELIVRAPLPRYGRPATTGRRHCFGRNMPITAATGPPGQNPPPDASFRVSPAWVNVRRTVGDSTGADNAFRNDFSFDYVLPAGTEPKLGMPAR